MSTSNFPLGGTTYFAAPPACSPTVTTNCYTTFTGTNFGNANPPVPGIQRNSLNGPGYKDVDATLAKSFGLPKARFIGEDAVIEFRIDTFNLFNNINLTPNSVVTNFQLPNFGQAQNGLSGRIVNMQARFSF